MFSGSKIDPATIRAYLETHYRVFNDPDFTLYVGEECSLLADVYRARNVSSAAFITAYNPYGEMVNDDAKQMAHSRLLEEIELREWHWIEGVGKHPVDEWPGEVSVLVFGITESESRILAQQFKQNGYLWMGADRVPKLFLTR